MVNDRYYYRPVTRRNRTAMQQPLDLLQHIREHGTKPPCPVCTIRIQFALSLCISLNYHSELTIVLS